MPSAALSLGIIGGADGPTAIFVTGKISPLIAAAALAALALAGLLWFLIRKKKDKK